MLGQRLEADSCAACLCWCISLRLAADIIAKAETVVKLVDTGTMRVVICRSERQDVELLRNAAGGRDGDARVGEDVVDGCWPDMLYPMERGGKTLSMFTAPFAPAATRLRQENV